MFAANCCCIASYNVYKFKFGKKQTICQILTAIVMSLDVCSNMHFIVGYHLMGTLNLL